MSEAQQQPTEPMEAQGPEKKSKGLVWIITALIVIVGGYFVFTQFNNGGTTTPSGEDPRLAELQESIEAAPVVGENLPFTEEQVETFKGQLVETQQQVKDVNYDTLQGLNTIAQLKRQLGDINGAIAAWEYANIVRPGNSLSFSNLAALYHFDLNEFEKAEEMYRISVNNDPDDLLTIRNFYELYHYATKDDTKAAELLAEARENNPEAEDMFTLSGRFYKEIGDNEKSIEMYEQALVINPANDAVNRELQKLRSQL